MESMEIYLVALACLISLAMAASVRAGYLKGRRGRLSGGRAGELRTAEYLDLAGGEDRLDDIVVGTTLYHSAQIDHLVRGPRSLIVVETKNWRGTLSGSPTDACWRLEKPSGEVISMRNPLTQADRQARIVLENVGSIPIDVQRIVVMSGRTTPATGQFPDGVCRAQDLRYRLPDLMKQGQANPDMVLKAWEILVEDAFSDEAPSRSERYMAWIEQRFGAKPWQGWLIVALALSTLTWTMSLSLKALQMKADGLM